MKKLFAILLILPFIYSCSSDDKETIEPEEPKQDYTSFVFIHNEPITVTDPIIGYYTPEGLCKKIAALDDLTQGVESKEIKIDDETIEVIYFFSSYPYPSFKLDAAYKLLRNKKNVFVMDKKTKGIHVDNKNPKEYPH